jgi:hypothetical protein
MMWRGGEDEDKGNSMTLVVIFSAAVHMALYMCNFVSLSNIVQRLVRHQCMLSMDDMISAAYPRVAVRSTLYYYITHLLPRRFQH